MGERSVTVQMFGRFVRYLRSRKEMPQWVNVLRQMAEDDLLFSFDPQEDRKSRGSAPRVKGK